MTDPLTLIKSLLALAASSNIDEGRNAAYAAAKLIHKHHVLLVLPAAANGTTVPTPSVRVHVPAPSRARPNKATEDGWRKMKAKYAGSCKWCGKHVKPNSPVYWSKDHGAYHPVCYLESQPTA